MWDVAFQNLAISIVRWNHRRPTIHEAHGRWIPPTVMILSSELQHLNNPLRHLDQWNLHDSKDMQHFWQFYSLLRVPKERDLRFFWEQGCRQLSQRAATSTLRTHSAPSGQTLTQNEQAHNTVRALHEWNLHRFLDVLHRWNTTPPHKGNLCHSVQTKLMFRQHDSVLRHRVCRNDDSRLRYSHCF